MIILCVPGLVSACTHRTVCYPYFNIQKSKPAYETLTDFINTLLTSLPGNYCAPGSIPQTIAFIHIGQWLEAIGVFMSIFSVSFKIAALLNSGASSPARNGIFKNDIYRPHPR